MKKPNKTLDSIADVLDFSVDKVPCPDDATWLAARSNHITASVAGALFNNHEYKTRFGLYHAIKGNLATEILGDEGAIERGNIIEDAMAGYLIERCGLDFDNVFHNAGAERVFLSSLDLGVGATPDFICDCTDGKIAVIQVKSVHPYVFRDSWLQPDESAMPPAWIILQASIEAFLVAKAQDIDPIRDVRAFVMPIVVDFDIKRPLIEIPLDLELWELFLQKAEEFWNDIKTNNEPDPERAKDDNNIQALHGVKGGSVDFTKDEEVAALVSEHNWLTNSVSPYSKRVKDIKAILQHKMAGAQVAFLQGDLRIKQSVSDAGVIRLTIPKIATSVSRLIPDMATGEPAPSDNPAESVAPVEKDADGEADKPTPKAKPPVVKQPVAPKAERF